MTSAGTLLATCEHNTDVSLAINGVGTANICVAGQFYERVVGVEGQLLPFHGLHEGQLRPRCDFWRGPLPFELHLST